MKNRLALLAFVLITSLACVLSPASSVTESKEKKSMLRNVPVTRAVTGTPVTGTRTEILSADDTFALCVTAEEGVWLRSKPWATSALNIPNALLAGTEVEVYLSPYGAHEWLEVYVPSEGVTGYVNTNYIGSCDDD